jgi:hypothetical protein
MYNDVAMCARHALVVCKPCSDDGQVHVWKLRRPLGRAPSLERSPACPRVVLTGMLLAQRHAHPHLMACAPGGHLVIASAASTTGRVRVGVFCDFVGLVGRAAGGVVPTPTMAVSAFLGGDTYSFWEVFGIACSGSCGADAFVAVLGVSVVAGALDVQVFGEGQASRGRGGCGMVHLRRVHVAPAPLPPMGIAFACPGHGSPLPLLAVMVGDRLMVLDLASGCVTGVPDTANAPHSLMRKRTLVSHPGAPGAVAALVLDAFVGVSVSPGTHELPHLPDLPHLPPTVRVSGLACVPGVGFLLVPKTGRTSVQLLVATAAARRRASLPRWRAAWLGLLLTIEARPA